ncbi:hypothetical protein AMATHDRAFT_8117 [Amanita thiersii Skay4041]|uniref:SWIM-type domain-containing protein n=1 Tax=Amanita thiersii Skay4041 TaxID=703135 RepID=A0A2A9ND55_9AGAR|nr:hypothetical protein AMATHDRAFT_8117 [Amanita thiersii Skay4041]
MPPTDVSLILKAVLDSIGPSGLSDDTLEQLQILLPETLILAALDLVDRQKVIEYTTPWGSALYEVMGSTAVYSVHLDMPSYPMPYYCTCPAFAYAVLMSETHTICKHVLASYVARQASLCLTRSVNSDDLVQLISRQCDSER